jgi:hypothetical protein
MPFTDWDPIVRASVFGAVFLVPLLAVLWVWYDTSGKTDSGRWYWRLVISALVVLTAPAVVLAAANLDVSQRDLMKIFGWLAIGSGGLAVLGVLGYGVWGRTPLPVVDEPASADFAYQAFEPGPADPPFEAQTLASAPTALVAPTVVAPAPSQANAGAYLFVKSGPDQGRQFPVAGQVTIGRSARCGVTLADSRVSSEHAQLKREGASYVYLDLKSTNGSYLRVEGREERLRSSQALVDGDEIRVGETVLQFISTPKGNSR